MRIIHTRKRVFKKDSAFHNKFTLLVWILSILKWKQYGEMVLYCDPETLEDIKYFGFDHLYDEINTTYLVDPKVCRGINFSDYWAMPKLLALRHEMLDLGHTVIVSDQDVVPIRDPSFLLQGDVAVWSDREHVELPGIYPALINLSLPVGFKLPAWYTGKAKPLNTGILYFKDKEIVRQYTDIALSMARNNKNLLKNTCCQTMCNAEQRTLGELVKHKNLIVRYMQARGDGLFGYNGFHTHGYKIRVKRDGRTLNWHLHILQLIKECDESMYNTLINHEWFQEEREATSFTPIKELQIYGTPGDTE